MEGFRGSGELPLDSEHPGDSFGASFSPRSSISTLFESIFMIWEVSSGSFWTQLGTIGAQGVHVGGPLGARPDLGTSRALKYRK